MGMIENIDQRMSDSYKMMDREIINLSDLIQTMTNDGDNHYHPHEEWYWTRRDTLLRSEKNSKEFLAMMGTAYEAGDVNHFTELFLELTMYMRSMADVIDELVENCDG